MNILREVSRLGRSRFPSGARIRRATHADYKAVLKLPRDDLDYLPDLYHSYIDHPCRQIYVCEKDNEIVASNMLFIVDDGQMAVSQAGRVKPSLQGHGIMAALFQHGLEDMRTKFPVKTLTWTTVDAEQTRVLIEWNRQLTCIEKHVIKFNLTPAVLTSMLQSDAYKEVFDECRANRLCLLTKDQAYKVLKTIQNMKNRNILVPGGLWQVKYEVFSPMDCNNHIAIEEFGSTIVTSTTSGKQLSDISFGSLFRCSYGYRYTLDFYADSNESKQLRARFLVGHVMKHLSMIAQRRFSKNINVAVYFPETPGIYKTELKDTLLSKLNWPYFDKEFMHTEFKNFIIRMNL